MELFIFRHSDWARLYNCSRINVTSIGLDKRQQFGREGIITIVLCAIYYILYIPSLFSLWRQQKTNVCYMLLFYIGIHDVGILWVIGFLHGFLALEGAVYCSRPILTAIGGSFINYFWYTESSADILLALHRFIEILAPKLGGRLFTKMKMRLYMGLLSSYGFFCLMYSKWPLFNGAFFGWLYNPYAGYIDDEGKEYDVALQGYHNLVVAFVTPSIYAVFFLCVYFKSRIYRITEANRGQISRLQINIFLQIFTIGILNTVGASMYTYIQQVEANQNLIIAAQFIWLHVHGFPPVIYLLLNKSIQMDTRRYIRAIFGKKTIK